MPTYDYFCSECKDKIEVFQKITAPVLKTCQKCNKETLTRKPGGGALSIKGDGFYSTMYGDKKTPTEGSDGCCPCGKNKNSCGNQ
jgi:putative FmdB family regulatory protein